MAETFLSNDNDEDKRETHWRKISKHLILELNEKILKRRQALSQNELPEDLSLLTSDEESTSVSRVLSDEYHRKKIMDAELKCKMLEGLDTLSETSSLSSSLCFQELDVEVPEEGDEKASTAENINSHNSGGDGRSDSDSVSYSTSFTGSIEEDCTSNVESNSSYVNAADSSSTLPPTIIDNNGINGARSTETGGASEERGTTSQENLEDKLSGFCHGDGENELNMLEEPGAEASGFQPVDDICISPYEYSDSERGDTSNYFPEKGYSPTIPESTDHTLNYIMSCGDRKDSHQQSKGESGKESFHDALDYSPFDDCETRTLNIDKKLDGFADIHELFIGQVGEETSREFMALVDAHHGESMDNFMTHSIDDQYTPTLIQHNHTHQNPDFPNIGQVNTSSVDESKPKGVTMFEIPFQNVSCNKGHSNKECAPKRKTASIVSVASTRRQTFLKDTLNRPLQHCIEKARLVASLRESIENARTMKDKVAGKAAYDKAISDFTEAVDRLLVDQVSINKEDDISFNDTTYSLDDTKVVRKAAPNPLDALRTPVNKRRMSAQKEIIKKKRLATMAGNEDEDILSPFEENEEIPQLQRTSTFVVIPTKKTDSMRQVLPTPVFEKDIAGVKSNAKTENSKSKNMNEGQFIKEELNETKLYITRTLQGIDGDEFPNMMDADRGDLTNTLGSHKDNDDTAYVSDLSPPLDNDNIYGANFTTFGLININEVVPDDDEISVSDKEKYGPTHCRKSAGNTFEINKGDQTFAVHVNGKVDDRTQDILQECCSHPSDDETLDIVDSLCNIDDESVDLNDFLPLEYDAHTKFSPRTSLDEPWFDNLEENTKEKGFQECISSCHAKDIDGKSMPDETDANLDQFGNYGNRSKTRPNEEIYIVDTTQDVDQSKHDQTIGLVSYGIVHTTENNSDRCALERARRSSSFENLHETLPYETRKGITFERDVLCPAFSDQEDQTDIRLLREEVQMQPDNLSKIVEGSNYGTVKSETSPKESLFSTSSSTSGEYSLLNAATRRGKVSVTPFSEIYPTTTDEESLKQDIGATQNPIFQKGFPRPSEMLVREKSATSIEEISVENPKIFHPLNDFPSAYVMKVDNDSVRKTLFSDSEQYAVFQTTGTNFENSINDLRKTAKGCLGPLRQKVAFFENIEKALQCQDTLTEHSTDGDCGPVNGENLQESPAVPDGDKSSSYVNDTFHQSENIYPKSQQSKVFAHVVLKESAVQTNYESLSPLEDQETQTAGVIEAVEKGLQCDFSQATEPDLKTLVDDLKERVLASNSLFERLHDYFEETASNASADRERINDSLETLNRRIHSNEAEVLARVSNVEDSVQTSTRDIGHSFQLIKDELSKLRCDTAEHFDCLKQHSGEMALQKKDIDVMEENVTRQFKHHMDKVHCDLQKLQELKPGPSSSTTEIPDTSKQCSIDDLRIRVIEMKNQRDAEKMYHKITRESMRALERDHDRLRQEVLMAATRRHLADRKKSFRLHSLAEESTIADIEVPPLTSTPRKGSDTQRKESPNRKADIDICVADSKENITTETAKLASDRKKERKSTKPLK